MNAPEIAALLSRLELSSDNLGAWSGTRGWAASVTNERITVHSPATPAHPVQVTPPDNPQERAGARLPALSGEVP